MKQKIVCRSSTESELVALSDATSLAAYELQLMESLGLGIKKAHLYQIDHTNCYERQIMLGQDQAHQTKVFFYKTIH